MFADIVSVLQELLLPLGGAGVFVAVALEEVIAPIPSALIMIGAGFLLLPGDALWWEVATRLFFVIMLPAALGVCVGSLPIYGVTYWYGQTAIARWGRYLGIYWEDVENLKLRFARSSYDELALIALRTLPIMPGSVLSALCGVVRIRLSTYLLTSFVGTLPRAGLLGLVGYFVGEAYTHYAEQFAAWENYILLGLAATSVIGLVWLIVRKRRRDRELIS